MIRGTEQGWMVILTKVVAINDLWEQGIISNKDAMEQINRVLINK